MTSADASHPGSTGLITTGRDALMLQVCREAAMDCDATLRADDRHSVETAAMGLLIFVERTSDRTRDGEPSAQAIRTTAVVLRGNGHWRAAHPHTGRFC